jgi:hypothetical protein
LIDQLLASPQLYPVRSLRPLIEAVGTLGERWPAGGSGGGSGDGSGDGSALRSQVVSALQAGLAQPERAADDPSLRGVEWTCRCADCTSLITWAESPQARPLVMAMAEKRRQHVEEQIAAAGALLSTTTLRQGSPYKLVLTKAGDLLARERAQREVWARDLAGLLGGRR